MKRTLAVLLMLLLLTAAACAANETGYKDVPADAWYYNAVRWAVSRGVTNGTGTNTFSPDAPCTRAQIVTFLYRDLNA